MAPAFAREHAPLLYFAAQFLTTEKRSSIFILYAASHTAQNQLTNSNDAKNHESLQEIIKKFSISPEILEDIRKDQTTALKTSRYSDFVQLQRHLHQTKGALSLAFSKILGYRDRHFEQHAINFGIGIGLTQILCSIKDDYTRGWIFLPSDEMNRFGLAEENIRREDMTANFRELLKFQTNRARQYLENIVSALQMVGDLPSRFAICLLKESYTEILAAIERQNDNIFKTPIGLSPLQKIFLIFKTFFKGQYL